MRPRRSRRDSGGERGCGGREMCPEQEIVFGNPPGTLAIHQEMNCSLAGVEAELSALIVCSAGACGLKYLSEGLERFGAESDFVELLKSLRISDGVQCLTDPPRTKPMPYFQGSLYSRPESS